MLVVTALSVFLNSLVIFRAVSFFRQRAECRESDKSTVAVLCALSAMFIFAQLVTWGAGPWMLEKGTPGSLLMMAFNFANSFFYLAHIKSLTERIECRLHHTPR